MALCCSSNNPIIFGEVLSRVDMSDITVHNSLALFTSILVGKYHNFDTAPEPAFSPHPFILLL